MHIIPSSSKVTKAHDPRKCFKHATWINLKVNTGPWGLSVSLRGGEGEGGTIP
jgi:hypothetical protein